MRQMLLFVCFLEIWPKRPPATRPQPTRLAATSTYQDKRYSFLFFEISVIWKPLPLSIFANARFSVSEILDVFPRDLEFGGCFGDRKLSINKNAEDFCSKIWNSVFILATTKLSINKNARGFLSKFKIFYGKTSSIFVNA